jgi:hypothetical protein
MALASDLAVRTNGHPARARKDLAATVDRRRRALDLDTKYFSVIVRRGDGRVAWILRCRPEDMARSYVRAIAGQDDGYTAELEPVELPEVSGRLEQAWRN